MEQTRQPEAPILETESPAAGLVVGMSSVVATDTVFSASVRNAADGVRPAFDPSCDVTLLDIGEVADVRTGARVVAVATHPTVADARRALGSGASGVLDRRGDADAILAALAAAVGGFTVLPPALAPALLTRLDDPPSSIELQPADLELLQDLATGMTLDDVALLRDRSTRTIRRDLRDLWRRMGVTGRAQGLVLAARWGVVA